MYSVQYPPNNQPYNNRWFLQSPPSSILIIGGAGGVGSMAIQLAKNLVNDLSSSTSFPRINVIATASRSESVEWCKKMGAICYKPS